MVLRAVVPTVGLAKVNQMTVFQQCRAIALEQAIRTGLKNEYGIDGILTLAEAFRKYIQDGVKP